MKHLLLFLIQMYWKLIPTKKRKECIFKVSCSNYVFNETKTNGFLFGMKALKFRFQNCRQGFEIFENPIDGSKQLFLPKGEVLKEEEMAVRLL